MYFVDPSRFKIVFQPVDNYVANDCELIVPRPGVNSNIYLPDVAANGTTIMMADIMLTLTSSTAVFIRSNYPNIFQVYDYGLAYTNRYHGQQGTFVQVQYQDGLWHYLVMNDSDSPERVDVVSTSDPSKVLKFEGPIVNSTAFLRFMDSAASCTSPVTCGTSSLLCTTASTSVVTDMQSSLIVKAGTADTFSGASNTTFIGGTMPTLNNRSAQTGFGYNALSFSTQTCASFGTCAGASQSVCFSANSRTSPTRPAGGTSALLDISTPNLQTDRSIARMPGYTSGNITLSDCVSLLGSVPVTPHTATKFSGVITNQTAQNFTPTNAVAFGINLAGTVSNCLCLEGTTSLSASAGTGSARPALPSLYLNVMVNGTMYKTPLYAA